MFQMEVHSKTETQARQPNLPRFGSSTATQTTALSLHDHALTLAGHLVKKRLHQRGVSFGEFARASSHNFGGGPQQTGKIAVGGHGAVPPTAKGGEILG